jgi:hypothetical protein
MTTLEVPLTEEESHWLSDWTTLSGYKTPADGIKEVLKVCGAIPKGHKYWKEKFSFAE